MGMDHLDRLLGDGPRIVCAPMVLGSELAFRMLVRQHGIRLCYTPMIRANRLAAGEADELELLETCGEDRPLVAQLCGRDPEVMASAVRRLLATIGVDAVDFNLGCPKECAARGGYGAFLQGEPELVVACVEAMCRAASPVPVFCKTRILEAAQESVKFARRLQDAGCSALALHCRTRCHANSGPPDFDQLAAVVAALRIPVIANGGIDSVENAHAVMAHTGAAAAMAATSLLRCPRAFDPSSPCRPLKQDAIDMALEYLDFARRFPPPSPRYLQKHMRWFFREEFEDAYLQMRARQLGDERAGVDIEGGADSTYPNFHARVWTFMLKGHLTEIWQFQELVRLVAHHQGRALPLLDADAAHAEPTFQAVRSGKRPSADDEDDTQVSLDWMFDLDVLGEE